MHGMSHKIYPTKAYKIAQKAIFFTLIQVRDSCVVCDVDMLTMNKIKILPHIKKKNSKIQFEIFIYLILMHINTYKLY